MHLFKFNLSNFCLQFHSQTIVESVFHLDQDKISAGYHLLPFYMLHKNRVEFVSLVVSQH